MHSKISAGIELAMCCCCCISSVHCFNSSVFIAISLLTLCGALVDATGDCLVFTSVVCVCVVVCVCISHCSVIIKIIFMSWNFFIMQCQHADSAAQRFIEKVIY